MTKKNIATAVVMLAGLAAGIAGAQGASRGFSGVISRGAFGGIARGGFSRGSMRAFSGTSMRFASVGAPRQSFVAGRGSRSGGFSSNFSQGFHPFGVSRFTSGASQGFSRVMSFHEPIFSSRPSGLTPVPVTHAPMPEQGMGYVFPRGYAVSQPHPPTIGQPLPSIESEVLRAEYSRPAPNLAPRDVIIPRDQPSGGGIQNTVNAGAFAPVTAVSAPDSQGNPGRRLGEGNLDQNPGRDSGPNAGN